MSTAADRRQRRVRATLRCESTDESGRALVESLLEKLEATTDTFPGGITEPVVRQMETGPVSFHRLAESGGLVWLDDEQDIIWLCHTGEENLETDEALLPVEADYCRLEWDEQLEIVSEIKAAAAGWIVEARQVAGQECRLALPRAGIEIYLLAETAPRLERFFVAVPLLGAAERGVSEKIAALICAAIAVELAASGDVRYGGVEAWPAVRAVRNYDLGLIEVQLPESE